MTDLTSEYVEEKMNIFFDSSRWHLSKKLISENQWCSIVVADCPGYIECEWLAEAAKEIGVHELLYLTHGGDLMNMDAAEVGDVQTQSISQKLDKFVVRSLVITTDTHDFAFFKQDDNQYFIVAGPEKFMKIAYRSSFEAARILFQGAHAYEDDLVQQRFMKIWDVYAVQCGGKGLR